MSNIQHKKLTGSCVRTGPGSSVAGFEKADGSLLLRFTRPIQVGDVRKGTLRDVAVNYARKGGKRVLLLLITPEAETGLLQLLIKRKEARERFNRTN